MASDGERLSEDGMPRIDTFWGNVLAIGDELGDDTAIPVTVTKKGEDGAVIEIQGSISPGSIREHFANPEVQQRLARVRRNIAEHPEWFPNTGRSVEPQSPDQL